MTYDLIDVIYSIFFLNVYSKIEVKFLTMLLHGIVDVVFPADLNHQEGCECVSYFELCIFKLLCICDGSGGSGGGGGGAGIGGGGRSSTSE